MIVCTFRVAYTGRESSKMIKGEAIWPISKEKWPPWNIQYQRQKEDPDLPAHWHDFLSVLCWNHMKCLDEVQEQRTYSTCLSLKKAVILWEYNTSVGLSTGNRETVCYVWLIHASWGSLLALTVMGWLRTLWEWARELLRGTRKSSRSSNITAVCTPWVVKPRAAF